MSTIWANLLEQVAPTPRQKTPASPWRRTGVMLQRAAVQAYLGRRFSFRRGYTRVCTAMFKLGYQYTMVVRLGQDLEFTHKDLVLALICDRPLCPLSALFVPFVPLVAVLPNGCEDSRISPSGRNDRFPKMGWDEPWARLNVLTLERSGVPTPPPVNPFPLPTPTQFSPETIYNTLITIQNQPPNIKIPPTRATTTNICAIIEGTETGFFRLARHNRSDRPDRGRTGDSHCVRKTSIGTLVTLGRTE